MKDRVIARVVSKTMMMLGALVSAVPIVAAIPPSCAPSPTEPAPPVPPVPPVPVSCADNLADPPTVRVFALGSDAEAYWQQPDGSEAVDGAFTYSISWSGQQAGRASFALNFEYFVDPNDAATADGSAILDKDFVAPTVVITPAGGGAAPLPPVPPVTIHPLAGSGTKRVNVRLKADPCYRIDGNPGMSSAVIPIMDQYNPRVGIVASGKPDAIFAGDDQPSPTNPERYINTDTTSLPTDPFSLTEGRAGDRIVFARDQIKYALDVRVEITDGMATCGQDFKWAGGAALICNQPFFLHFDAGQRSATVLLFAPNDGAEEPREDSDIHILPFIPLPGATPYRQWDHPVVTAHRTIFVNDPPPPAGGGPGNPGGDAGASEPECSEACTPKDREAMEAAGGADNFCSADACDTCCNCLHAGECG